MHGYRAARAAIAIALTLTLTLTGAASATEVPEPNLRVLVLSELDPGTPASMEVTSGLRAELDPGRGYAVHLEFLDRFRYPTPTPRADARDWLRARWALDPPAVVVALGEEAIELLANPETTPWPGVPVVFSLTDGRAAVARRLPPAFTGIIEHSAAAETVALPTPA